MASTHPTRRPTRTSKRPGRRTSLLRLRLGTVAAVVLILYIAVRTWPVHAAIAATLIAAVMLLRAIRPARLNPLWDRLDTRSVRGRALPRAGRRALEAFHRMTPDRFEEAIAELALEDPRITHASRVGGANDRGADVLLQHADGRRILIQCKRYRHGNNIGSETVQTINGVYRDIHACHEAAIVTTASFTGAALQTNSMLARPIRLIDGTTLTAWANGGTPPWG